MEIFSESLTFFLGEFLFPRSFCGILSLPSSCVLEGSRDKCWEGNTHLEGESEVIICHVWRRMNVASFGAPGRTEMCVVLCPRFLLKYALRALGPGAVQGHVAIFSVGPREWLPEGASLGRAKSETVDLLNWSYWFKEQRKYKPYLGQSVRLWWQTWQNIGLGLGHGYSWIGCRDPLCKL